MAHLSSVAGPTESTLNLLLKSACVLRKMQNLPNFILLGYKIVYKAHFFVKSVNIEN